MWNFETITGAMTRPGTTAGVWDCVTVIERLLTLCYSVNLIDLSFRIIVSSAELGNHYRVNDETWYYISDVHYGVNLII